MKPRIQRDLLTRAAALLVAVTAASAISAQVTLANYPLITDLFDSTSTYGPIVLSGYNGAAPPALPNNGVYHNGVYYYSNPGGQNIQSPVITGLDSTDFQIAIDFNLTQVPTPYNRPIIVGGNGYRWIGLYADTSAHLGVLYNNSNYTWSTTTVTPGIWNSATIKFEGGFLELYLNGTLIHNAILPVLNTNNNFNFTTNNFSNGTALDGWIRNLVIANDTTLSGTYGINSTQGIGCGAGNPIGTGAAYELFGATPFDLSGTAQTYVWTGSGYLLIDGASSGIVPPVGAPTAFSDDQTRPVALPFSFPCARGMVNTVYLCSNGWLSFEPTTNTDYLEGTALMLSGPTRLAFLWDDLDAGSGGTINTEAVSANEFDITFTNVPEYGVANSNTCQIALFDTGLIQVRYGTCSLLDGMVGLSVGHGATDLGPTDYSGLSAGSVSINTGVGPFWTSLSLSATTRPVLGTNWNLQVDIVPAGTIIGIHWFGLANPGIPDLSAIGMPGCGLYSSLDVLLGPWVPAGPTYTYGLSLPLNPALIGIEVFTQAAMANIVPANAFGFDTTNGMKGKLGDV